MVELPLQMLPFRPLSAEARRRVVDQVENARAGIELLRRRERDPHPSTLTNEEIDRWPKNPTR